MDLASVSCAIPNYPLKTRGVGACREGRQRMAKTAVSQLQEQIEAIRREAFAAGFEAAMQSVRQFASTQTPDTGPQSAEPARRRSMQRYAHAGFAAASGQYRGRAAAGSGKCRQAAARHERPAGRRGTAIECAAGAAPGRDPQHDPARERRGDRVHLDPPRAGAARSRASVAEQVADSNTWRYRGGRRDSLGEGR